MPIDGLEIDSEDGVAEDCDLPDDGGIVEIVEDEYLERDGGVDEPLEMAETLSPHDNRSAALSATLRNIS